MTTFNDLGLIEPLLRALATEGYTTPTPIQAGAIPTLIEGHDLMGVAQTGTGKTAAFALPLLQRLAASPRRAEPKSCRVLVLVPTRELAIQVADSFKTYGRHMSVRATVIFGGVGQEPQVRSVARGIDIVVATPGRLLDLINQRHVRLDGVEAVVLDEADRMLDMGFIHDMRKIVRLLPAQRQTVMFSATMPPAIQELAQGILKNPKHVAVTPAATTVERIDQRVMFVEKSQKRALLLAVLQQQPDARAIVFTRTKHGADRVAEQLEKGGVNAAAIHGNKSQGQRQKALDSFRRGTLRILVATDIASRGIDVEGIGLIINFDLPHEPESYVHRIGRTARAGADGMAISFCDADEVADLRQIEKTIRRAVPMDTSHPYHVQHAAPGRNAAPRQGRGRQGAGGHHAGHNGGHNNGGGHRQQQGKGRPGGGARQGRSQRDGRQDGRQDGHRGSQHRGGRGRVVSAGGAV